MISSFNDEAVAFLDEFAEPVGFSRCELPGTHVPGPPAEAAIWRSEYGLLVAWPSEWVLLERTVRDGKRWLDVALAYQEERLNTSLDGYLVILVGEEPDDRQRRLVREVELDPEICRKTVAWPLPASNRLDRWSRLLRVTALALPFARRDATNVIAPNLSEDQKKLIESLMRSGVAPTVRRYVGEAS